MKLTPITLSILLFFSIMISSIYCNGQVKTSQPKDRSKPENIRSGQAKLTKTQGSDQFASIRCAVEDKEGNLWFGTTGEGVYRYDGKQFTQFTVKDGVSSNVVYAMLQDKDGTIWFGTDNGICRYKGGNITVVPINLVSNLLSPGTVPSSPSEKNEVWSILQDKTGKMWFGTNKGVYCYNGRAFTRFLDNDGVINSSGLHLKMVDHMLEDKNGHIWFASGMPPGMEGLCRYDGKSLVQFNPGGEKWIRYILEDRSGAIWMGGRHYGVWRYDGKDFTRFLEGENISCAALQDKDGNVWLGGGENGNGLGRTGTGMVWRYDGKSLSSFTTKDGLGDYSVWCMIEDRAGNIWIGTRNTDLYRYDGKSFTRFSE